MNPISELIELVTSEFCQDFVRDPYLCYTEHGLHALYFTKLYNELSEDNKFVNWMGERVCILQKEYPTQGRLGKPQRQHWDIAVIKDPPESENQTFSYDYLRLSAVVEFGLNEDEAHLVDDIERLCHPDANLEQGILVHLYRLSKAGRRFSNRDWSPNSPRIVTLERSKALVANKPIELYYAIVDSTRRYPTTVAHIKDGVVNQLV
jgi:hypothetical protein